MPDHRNEKKIRVPIEVQAALANSHPPVQLGNNSGLSPWRLLASCLYAAARATPISGHAACPRLLPTADSRCAASQESP
jgi:hypothetical protein